MRNTKWIFNKHENFPNFYEGIPSELHNILFSKGLLNESSVDKFLNPALKKIGDPIGLTDVDKASDLIIENIKNRKEIWIYGDYDVDGITSTSLSYLSLTDVGGVIKYYIPLRDEGYGLNCEALQHIYNEGGRLIITVDCGITSHKEIEFANSLGISVIITDHHDIINGLIPNAYAVINPKREDNLYPFKYLAGVGTVFMLLLAVYKKLGKKKELFKYLDLVALGTIADIVSLLDDNRIFVKHGLDQLKNTTLPSLKTLLKKIFFEDYDEKNFSTYDVGFIIAPIFNAAGRLEDAKTSVEFLISRDHTKYISLIDTLLANNQMRKEVQKEILEKCIEKIEKDELYNKHLILLGDESFHHGVIGIVASKILEKYYKPVIVLEKNLEEGIAKASCRSTESFNMIEALTKHSNFLLKFGGHHGAAGFSIKLEDLDEFYKEINRYCGEITHEEDRLKPIKFDKFISLDDINYDFFTKLSFLEPHGFGNPAPLFAAHNLEYTDLKLIGKDKTHLSLTLKDKTALFKNSVWFSAGDLFPEIEKMDRVSIVFKPVLERFNEKYMYKLRLEDLKSSSDNVLIPLIKNSIMSKDKIKFPITSVFYSDKTLPNTERLSIKLEESYGTIYHNKVIYGFLENQIFNKLKESGYSTEKFYGDIIKIVETDKNFNVFIAINPDYSFISYATTPGKIFSDIKTHLLGNEEYSQLEKNILGEIFKKESSVTLSDCKEKELEVIMLTISIYFHYLGKNTLIVREQSFPYKINEKLEFFSKVSTEFEPNADFYLFLGDNIPKEFVEYSNKEILPPLYFHCKNSN